jgi:hypothetical protein
MDNMTWGWLLAAAGGFLVLHAVMKLKIVPVNPKQAAVGGIIILFIGCALANIGGVGTWLDSLGVPVSGGGAPITGTAGANFVVEGSESDTYLVYDVASKTFSCSFYENQTSGKAESAGGTGTAGTAINGVTLTLTIYDQSYGSVDNGAGIMIPIAATVQEFNGKAENSGITYTPIIKDTDNGTGKFLVSITPSGSSARMEQAVATVSRGGTKTVTVVLSTSHTGLCQLTTMEYKDTVIRVGGTQYGQPEETFTVRFLKVGTQA